VPCVILAAAGALSACTDETVFTAEERDELQTYKLPPVPPPNPSNRVANDEAAAVLGKKFFFDARLSGALGPVNDGVTNGSLGKAGDLGKVACYSCHQVDTGGGADLRSRPGTVSLGVSYGGRNAPTVINAAYSDVARGGWQAWDGAKDSLWALALGPLENPVTHAGTRLQYAHILYDHYRADYEAIFGQLPDLSDAVRFPASGKPGQPGFDMMAPDDKVAINRIYSNIGKSIEAYERRLISPSFDPSPFDKMLAGDDTAMSPAAIRGARLFIGKAACNECHRGPTFTDLRFHNIGCPQRGDFIAAVDIGRSAAIAKVQGDLFNRAGAFSDAPDNSHLVVPEDKTMPIMAAEVDKGAFKTPTLRNVSKTGPYMHDGVYGDLWEVVEHYNFGGNTGAFSGTKEVTISPLLLSSDEMNDLVEFLRSLADGDPLPSPAFPEGLLKAPTLPN